MAWNDSYRHQVDAFEQKAQDLDSKLDDISKQNVEDSRTRQTIAKIFVYIYFALLTLLIVGIPIYNIVVIRITNRSDLTIPLTDIIQTYSAVVGPTLGFVIAYYFKNRGE